MAYAAATYQTAPEVSRPPASLATCLERLRGLHDFVNSLESTADRTVGPAIANIESAAKAPAPSALLYAIDEEISNLTGRLNSLANRLGNLA